jgi:hypothetical protein
VTRVVRAVWTELVERKLWPVAAALVVALVAVPLLLAGGGDKAAPATAPMPSGTAAGAHPATVVSLQSAASGKPRNRKGSVRDPFLQQHVQAPATSAAATTGSASGTSGPAAVNLTPASPLDSNYGANPVAGDDSGGSGAATGPRTATTTLPTGSNVYHAVIRIKQLGKETYLHDAARYDYVPSDTHRDMLFLGVLADRRTAVFSMLTPGHYYGDGRCRPVRRFCVTMEMRPGNSELLTLSRADGSVRRVRVTLIRIFAKKAKAAGAKARSSSADRANRALAGSFVK